MRTTTTAVQHFASNRPRALRTLRAHAVGVAIILAAFSSQVFAQTTGMHEMPSMHGSATSPAETPAVKAFKAADQHMMQQMSAGYTGDTDQDFVTHMLPHHEGAVEMAKIQLKYGKDPALMKLARDIISAQDKEIQFMKAWQAKHPAKQ